MLPFLQPKKIASVIMARHTKNGPESIKEEGEVEPGLQAAAEALIRGMSSKDASAVARALQSAFELADSDPSPPPAGPTVTKEE